MDLRRMRCGLNVQTRRETADVIVVACEVRLWNDAASAELECGTVHFNNFQTTRTTILLNGTHNMYPNDPILIWRSSI
jgi:hypothetical protein